MAKKKKKKNNTRTKVVFWIALILFLLPFAVMGYILLSAARDTHTPVIGNRYENDLNPAITETQMNQIESDVKGLSGVESVSVRLTTATLRVYADISDSADASTAESTAESIYSKVTGVLDPSSYFFQHDNEKMYDLEIHVYNSLGKADSDSFVYVIENKTSNMDSPHTQLVSEPVNAELAQQLRDAVDARNNPVPSSSADSNELKLSGEDAGIDTASPDAEGEDTTDNG